MLNLWKLTIADEVFCTFEKRTARRPFKILFEDVPCQRQKTLENYHFSIIEARQNAKSLRLRIKVDEFFAMDMEFKENPDGFSLSLLPETLVEYCPNQFRILELDLLPGFLSAKKGSGGYFLLPNFCGSLMHFTDDKAGELRDMVYGDQKENEHYVTMPICGLNEQNGGWLCIFTDGRYDARIVTSATREECQLSPAFILRHNKASAVITEHREVQFIRLNGNADYNAMARRYRQHLLQERNWLPLAKRLPGNPVLDYTARSYHCKIFHGMKFNRTYDGYDPLTVTTTFDEAARIAEGMKNDGIDRCTFFLVGWNPGGHDGQWPTRFPIEEKAGGLDGFLRLKQKLTSLGYRLSLHDNHADSYRSSEFFALCDHLTDSDGEIIGGSQWGGGATYRICMKTAPSAKSILDMKRLKELGIDGIYYLDNMPSPIFTCHDPRHPCSRREYVMGVRRLMRTAADIAGCSAAEGYQDYALDDVDMPWKVHPPVPEMVPYFSRVPMIDRLVPFFQVAYHGIRLYHCEYGYAYPDNIAGAELELALGALPMNEVQERPQWYIPSWHDCRKQMQRHHQLVNVLHDDRQSVFIESIQLDDKKIFTQYADGIHFEFLFHKNQEAHT
ncbi:MAG: DUF5696 domain-containing protein [Lentisphaeria bacterium]|nr:DUF5696 domain-containing protein [Lentisphaeria bacterium]